MPVDMYIVCDSGDYISEELDALPHTIVREFGDFLLIHFPNASEEGRQAALNSWENDDIAIVTFEEYEETEHD